MNGTKIRKPAVAGQFYPSTAQGIKNQIDSFVDKSAKKDDAIACMLPHAGYIYSGAVAAQTLSRIYIKDKIILLGPNHTGNGTDFSVMSEGAWETPLGQVKIDSLIAERLVKNSKFLTSDELAHQYEHSLEVELPLLQYFKKDFEIVPIAFLTDDLQALKQIGGEIAAVIKESGISGSTLILASSDMTHFESKADAQKKDSEAIKAILELNEDKLMEKIRKLNISMCGYAPAVVMIAAAKALGAKQASLTKYTTSAEATGDTSSVVGYAGIIVT